MPVEAAGEYSSPEQTFCADSYSVSVPPRVTAVTCKRPWSFCQKCRWQAIHQHAYALDPTLSKWADYCCPGIVWEPIRETNLLATRQGTLDQSSELAELLWTDLGVKREISVHELIT